MKIKKHKLKIQAIYGNAKLDGNKNYCLKEKEKGNERKETDR